MTTTSTRVEDAPRSLRADSDLGRDPFQCVDVGEDEQSTGDRCPMLPHPESPDRAILHGATDPYRRDPFRHRLDEREDLRVDIRRTGTRARSTVVCRRAQRR